MKMLIEIPRRPTMLIMAVLVKLSACQREVSSLGIAHIDKIEENMPSQVIKTRITIITYIACHS